MGAREAGRLVRATFGKWSGDKALRLGAALSYYAVFSLPPLLVIVAGVAGMAFGEEAAQGRLVEQFRGLMGEQGARIVQTVLASGNGPGEGFVAAVLGMLALLLGATGVFAELQDALNTIWGVRPRPGRTLRDVVRIRALSVALVVSLGFLLLVSLVVSTLLAAFGNRLASITGLSGAVALVAHAVHFVVSLGVLTFLFGLIMKVLPDVRIGWRDVGYGAAVTALLFTIGKSLLGMYLGRSGAASAYGAAGSLVLVLLWVFYSSQIFFLGAEFTCVYARRRGRRIEPDEHAEPVGDAERAARDDAA